MENVATQPQPTQIEDISSLSRTSLEELVMSLMKANKSIYRVCLVLGIGLVIVSILAAVGFYRRPKVIVAVQSADGQRITQIDDTKFGSTEQIQMGEDNLSNKDKNELIENWLQGRFAIDLASRSKDVPKFLSLMIPSTAGGLFKQLNETGELQRERDEGWSGSWKTDSIDVDRNDKNIVQVIGTQNLRKVVAGKPKTERIQYKIVFSLHTEGKRDNSPLRTGYWIVNYKDEVLSRTEGA
jgi:hypothetical protein